MALSSVSSDAACTAVTDFVTSFEGIRSSVIFSQMPENVCSSIQRALPDSTIAIRYLRAVAGSRPTSRRNALRQSATRYVFILSDSATVVTEGLVEGVLAPVAPAVFFAGAARAPE